MNNNNFGLKDVIKFYKKEGYIFYNSSTIKTLKDYLDFEKYKRKNKDKLIIYIKLSSLYTKHTTKFYKKLMTILINLLSYKFKFKLNNKNNLHNKHNLIFLYNSKYLLCSEKAIKNKNKLSIIQNILFSKFYKCDICFDEEFKVINSCSQCNLYFCNNCKNKLKKISNKCCCCKNYL